MQWQFICRYDTDTAQEPGSLFWCHAMMSLQFAHVRSFACRGRLQNLLADCSTIGLYCVKITRQINLQTFTSVSVVGVFRMWPELLLLTARGVTRGSRGHNFPGAESLCGRRKVPTMSQVLSSIQNICFRKTQVRTRTRQTCFLSRAPSILVTPLPTAFFFSPKSAYFSRPWCLGLIMKNRVKSFFFSDRFISNFNVFNNIAYNNNIKR